MICKERNDSGVKFHRARSSVNGEFGRTSKVVATERNIAKEHTRIIDEDKFWQIVEKAKQH